MTGVLPDRILHSRRAVGPFQGGGWGGGVASANEARLRERMKATEPTSGFHLRERRGRNVFEQRGIQDCCALVIRSPNGITKANRLAPSSNGDATRAWTRRSSGYTKMKKLYRRF